MSIVRVGLAETKKFSDGYDAIFGKRKAGGEAQPQAKSSSAKKKKPKKAKKK